MAELLPVLPSTQRIFDPVTGAPTIDFQNFLVALNAFVASVSGAPLDATYWTSSANSTLTNETNVGLLSSGYVKITVALGVATPSSVTKVPVADGGTNLTSGTSGGILAFTGSTTLASSAELSASAVVFGGGAGVVPTTTPNGGFVISAPTLSQNSTLAMRPVAYQLHPSDPTGTTSATIVMMGIAGAYTPRTSANLLVICSFLGTSSSSADGFIAQVRYGTGSAPANGDASTGTQVGQNMEGDTTPSTYIPCTINGIVTGLTPGTAYWFDLGLSRVTAGTASLKNISLSIMELG